MKHIRLYITTLLLLVGLSTAALVPAVALAATPQATVCTTLGGPNDSNCATTPAGGINLDTTIKAAINILSVIVGIAAVIMIMVCGLRMITSAGDSNGIASARTGIIYALVGLVVVAFAQFLVLFVLDKIKSK